MNENAITEADIQDIKDQIARLIEKLPFIERGDYDVFMMSIDLQQEITALIQRKDKEHSETISDLIDVSLKKQKAIDQLITLNEKIKQVWGSLTGEQKTQIEAKGMGIRSVINKKKNDDINKAIADNEANKRKDNSEVQQGAGEGAAVN